MYKPLRKFLLLIRSFKMFSSKAWRDKEKLRNRKVFLRTHYFFFKLKKLGMVEFHRFVEIPGIKLTTFIYKSKLLARFIFNVRFHRLRYLVKHFYFPQYVINFSISEQKNQRSVKKRSHWKNFTFKDVMHISE